MRFKCYDCEQIFEFKPVGGMVIRMCLDTSDDVYYAHIIYPGEHPTNGISLRCPYCAGYGTREMKKSETFRRGKNFKCEDCKHIQWLDRPKHTSFVYTQPTLCYTHGTISKYASTLIGIKRGGHTQHMWCGKCSGHLIQESHTCYGLTRSYNVRYHKEINDETSTDRD